MQRERLVIFLSRARFAKYPVRKILSILYRKLASSSWSRITYVYLAISLAAVAFAVFRKRRCMSPLAPRIYLALDLLRNPPAHLLIVTKLGTRRFFYLSSRAQQDSIGRGIVNTWGEGKSIKLFSK